MAITDVTRGAIIDAIILGSVEWAGRLDEVAFLSRLYPLTEMASRDHRFGDAAGDIWQHRVNNAHDWEDDWVFYDPRFDLMHGDDEPFLKFLAETVHPRVRPVPEEAAALVETYNEHLRPDGYELVAVTTISGRPVYAARSLLSVPGALRDVERSTAVLDRDYMSRLITRMEASIETDPELAIGTAKELIEAACKTILEHHGVAVNKKWDVPKLMWEAAELLKLTPEGVPETAPAAQTIRKILGSLAAVVGGTAELRNEYGTGHGKGPRQSSLQPRHARLAVSAASTLAVFLFETFEQRGAASRP